VERLRTALAKDLPDILKKVVESAKGGDIAAARTILERVLPPLKAIEVPVYVPRSDGSLTEQGRVILDAMARGMIAPGNAAQLLGALASQGKIMEVDEFARRLGELETRLGVPNGHG
jgi:hypothetical protein